MRARALLLAVLLTGALVLAACGKKGEPESPDKNSGLYPRTYPSR